MADRFAGVSSPALNGPASHAFDIVPSNDDDLAVTTRAIYVGTGGHLKVSTAGGSTVTFKNAPGGVVLPVRATRVFATGTGATDIVGLY